MDTTPLNDVTLISSLKWNIQILENKTKLELHKIFTKYLNNNNKKELISIQDFYIILVKKKFPDFPGLFSDLSQRHFSLKI